MKHWRRNLILAGVLLAVLYVGDFYFTRWVHYKLSYESLVKGEIRAMVKPACLLE